MVPEVSECRAEDETGKKRKATEETSPRLVSPRQDQGVPEKTQLQHRIDRFNGHMHATAKAMDWMYGEIDEDELETYAPKSQGQACEEIFREMDEAVGKDVRLQASDIFNLVYIDCIMRDNHVQ